MRSSPATVLSEQQANVASRIKLGLTPKQIASELGVSDRRVRQIVTRISVKWGLDRDKSLYVQIAQRAA